MNEPFESSAVVAKRAGTLAIPFLLGRSVILPECGFWVGRAGKCFAVELWD